MGKLTNFNRKIREDGIILWGCYHLFDLLREVSIFQQIRNFAKWRWDVAFKKEHPKASEEKRLEAWNDNKPFTHTYLFPELWAIMNISLALLGCFVMANISCKIIVWLFITYVILRMFELFVYQVNMLLFDPIKSEQQKRVYRIKSATRSILLLICNIFEYILWFSVIYIFFLAKNNPDVDSLKIVLESITTLANIATPEDISQYEDYMAVTIIAYVESVLGIFMNIICLARFISLLPPVSAMNK